MLLDWWKEIVNDIVLPVAYLSITLDFRFCILDIVNVQSRVVLEVAERDFIEFLCEQYDSTARI